MTKKKKIKTNIISNIDIRSLVLISALIALIVFNAGCVDKVIDDVLDTPLDKDTDSPVKDTDEFQKDVDELFKNDDVEVKEFEDTICPTLIPKKAIHHTENLRYDYWTIEGVRVGLYQQWFDEGKTQPHKRWCCNTKGELHGLCVTWFNPSETGGREQKWQECNYKNGTLDGSFKRWCLNGNLTHEITYRDGYLHGPYKGYYQNGNPSIDANYVNRKIDGEVISYYDPNDPTKYRVTVYENEGTVQKNEETIPKITPEPTSEMNGEEYTEVGTQGIIDTVIKYEGIDHLDENACTPLEYAYQDITEDNKISIHCKCKPGYKRAYGGCMFDKPEDTKLSNDELKQLELTLRTLGTNQHSIIKVVKDGKEVKLGILRRVDQSLLYTLDGKTWDPELKNILNPGWLYNAWGLIDSITAINPVNQFDVPYTNKDKQMRYEVASETLKSYKEISKNPKHFNQYVYEYYNSAKDKKAAIETIQSSGILSGTTTVFGGKLVGYAMTFPGEAINKFVDEARTQQFGDGFYIYSMKRKEYSGKTPQEIMEDNRMIGVRGQLGLEASMGRILLCQLYEESYQRYLLRKTLSANKDERDDEKTDEEI